MNSRTVHYAPQKPHKRKHPTSEKIKQNVTLIQKLYLARDKLLPVIYSLMRTQSHHKGIISSSYYLTNKQLEDAVLASKIINEFCKKISHFDDTVNVRTSEWDFTNAKSDSDSKVFIDASTLFHLLDLNKTLSYLIETYGGDKEFPYTNIDFNENDNQFKHHDEAAVRKYMVKLSQPLLYDNFFNNYQQVFGDEKKEYIVMSTHNHETDSYPTKSWHSQHTPATSTMSFETDTTTQETPKTGYTTSEGEEDNADVVSKVTDVYGARDIIFHCINDLTRVKSYLETKRIDVGIDTTEDGSKPSTSLGSVSTGGAKSKGRCSCEDCSNVENEGEETIICIKGKNDDENDIQIIVKQPPANCKCKKSSGAEGSQPKSKPFCRCTKQTNEEELRQYDTMYSTCCPCKKYSETLQTQTPKYENATQLERFTSAQKTESRTLHNKDSEVSFVCSVSSMEEIEASIQEVVNNIKPTNKFESMSPTQDCSQVRFKEQNNLCLTTDTGEELMLSFTLKPVNQEREQLRSKSAIKGRRTNVAANRSRSAAGSEEGFAIGIAENEYQSRKPNSAREKSRSSTLRNSTQRSATQNEVAFGSATRRNMSRSNRKFSTSKNLNSSGAGPQNMQSNTNVFVSEVCIPLTRTKVCSSLEFDVAMVETSLRETGVISDQPKIVVRLNEMGVNNLLRASRPAKCARKAVLNEKQKKCVPYSASLRSLPLDERELNIINQSLQMNLQKVKNSTDIRQKYAERMVYYFGLKNKEQPERLPWTITH